MKLIFLYAAPGDSFVDGDGDEELTVDSQTKDLLGRFWGVCCMFITIYVYFKNFMFNYLPYCFSLHGYALNRRFYGPIVVSSPP